MGNNDFHQLKTEVKNIWVPQKIDISNCSKISCGDRFSMALTTSDGVIFWGKIERDKIRYDIFREKCSETKNDYPITKTIYTHCCSIPRKQSDTKKILVGNNYLLFLLYTGEVYVRHKNLSTSIKKIDLPITKDIYCHNNNLFAISEMNVIYTWNFGKTPEKFTF